MTHQEIARVLLDSRGGGRRDADACIRWIHEYVWIEDRHTQRWIKLRLWDAQIPVIRAFVTADRVVALKARQVGITWCAEAVQAWRNTCFKNESALFYSAREEDAIAMVDERLRGILKRLPTWMQPARGRRDSTKFLTFQNGGNVRAMPGNRGDSYQVATVLLDEEDLIEDQDALHRAVRPTIDGGGQLWEVSKVRKSRPDSRFKRNYIEAKTGGDPNTVAIFLPWWVRPDRTKECV